MWEYIKTVSDLQWRTAWIIFKSRPSGFIWLSSALSYNGTIENLIILQIFQPMTKALVIGAPASQKKTNGVSFIVTQNPINVNNVFLS